MTLSVRNITPTGDIDGINTVFTAPSTFIANSTAVYIDLGRIQLNVDYTELNSTQINIDPPPSVGESVMMDYNHDDGIADSESGIVNPRIAALSNPRIAALSNPSMVRDLIPLLDNNDSPTDAQIRSVGRGIDAKIGLMLAGKYLNPPTPSSYIFGTVTTQANDRIVTGSGTTFTNLQPGQTIQIVGSGEVLRVQSVVSDTSFIADSLAAYSASGSYHWIVPEELVTASMWLTAHAVIMLYYPEKTLKQDNIEKFDRRLEFFAGDIIKQLKSGEYLNAYLQEQLANQSIDRLVYIGISNDNRDRVDTNHDLFHGGTFK